jgi:hypothetical protein
VQVQIAAAPGEMKVEVFQLAQLCFENLHKIIQENEERAAD